MGGAQRPGKNSCQASQRHPSCSLQRRVLGFARAQVNLWAETDVERRMNALFETDAMSAKRTETGSRIRINAIPREFSPFTFLYENPIHALNIGIVAIFVSETFSLKQKQYDRVIQQPVSTAIILEKGRLKATLEQTLGPSVSNSVVDNIVNDIYELMLEWLNNDLTQYYHFNKSEVDAHIYEAEPRPFDDAVWHLPTNVKPGPEVISKLQAERVF
jgi:hypothetical protein